MERVSVLREVEDVTTAGIFDALETVEEETSFTFPTVAVAVVFQGGTGLVLGAGGTLPELTPPPNLARMFEFSFFGRVPGITTSRVVERTEVSALRSASFLTIFA
ncbi:hypothetical protein [Spongorhabdus nitratireducens]